jgi:hypothetical protein
MTAGNVSDTIYVFPLGDIGQGISNPVDIPAAGHWPGNFGLTVEVFESSTSLITKFPGHDESMAPVSNSYTNISLMDSLRRHLDLRWRILCATDYYGDDCSVYCKPRDDTDGHYTCNSNGTKECRVGYLDPLSNCTTKGEYVLIVLDE